MAALAIVTWRYVRAWVEFVLVRTISSYALTVLYSKAGMKTSLLFIASIFLVSATDARAADQVIYPTGAFPQDLENVQAAVNVGGRVLLKATDVNGAPQAFNFGPATASGRRVTTVRDTEIVGETTGAAMTTVIGGNLAILSLGGHLAVRGIHFDGQRAAAVLIAVSTGAEITGNWITHVTGFPTPFGVKKGQGIWVTFVSSIEAISGNLLISDNLIDNIDAEEGLGIAMAGFASEARVVRNRIRGVNTEGILVVGNLGPVWVEDNVVIPGPEKFPGIASAGIGIAAGMNTLLFGLTELGGPYYINRNEVVCDNPNADCILLFESRGAVVTNNHLVLRGAFDGITLLNDASDSYIGQNRVEGTGLFAIDIFQIPLFEPSVRANTFVGNNIARMRSEVVDVFLDVNAQDTVLVGQSGSVVDLGVNNSITGFTKSGSGLGQQIREAQARKHELLRALDAIRWPDEQ